MRWFKRSSADTPHLKRLSPLKSNELLQPGGSLHPAVLVGGDGTSAATAGGSGFQSGEVGSRNEFLSVSMLNGGATTTTNRYYDDEQQRWQQYADASKHNDSDRHSRSKENRRDWRRSYNRNTINCYNIQEGKIVNSGKGRDRSLSPSFLRRKRSDVMDVRKIFETKKTKEPKEIANHSQDNSVNTVRIRSRNNLVKERRNPLPTTRLSFCETKLIYDDNTSYSTYQDATTAHLQSYNVDSLAPRLNEILSISTTTNRDSYSTNRIYNNHERDERYKTKVNKNSGSILGNKSKSVEDFSKEDIMTLNRINKPENKFKTLSGKTQKFLSNFYRTRWDKNASVTPSKQQLLQSPQNYQHQQHQHTVNNHSYESNIRYASDLPVKSTVAADELMNNEWCLPSHCPLSDSCYSTMVDSHLMTTSTDADSGILENDSGQSSLNSLPVAESISTLAPTTTTTDPGMIGFNDASLATTNGNDSRMMANADFLVTILCDESFKDISKHLYHSKESYYMTNIIVKKIKLVDGFILAGDEILDICGIPIRGKPYIEVYNLLQNIHRNSRNDYVRIVVRRISEVANGGSNGLTNAYQKGVVNSRRNGIGGLLRDMERTSEKSLDYAATAIRIDGSRSKLKPPIDTPTSQRRSSEQSAFKVASMHFQKNISTYGSISRKFIRRSVLGRAASSSVIDVSQAEPEISTVHNDDTSSMPNSLCSDSESVNTEVEQQQSSVSSNFFTLPRKNKIGVYGFHTICYEKGPGKKSLGFTIVGGRDSPKGAIGIFVKRILSTGQAIEDGRLRVGDEILSVNGQVCHDLSHEEAVKMFKSIRSGEIVLRVCRREKQNLGGAAEGRSNRDSQITNNCNDT